MRNDPHAGYLRRPGRERRPPMGSATEDDVRRVLRAWAEAVRTADAHAHGVVAVEGEHHSVPAS
jgi:hypothetical protein